MFAFSNHLSFTGRRRTRPARLLGALALAAGFLASSLALAGGHHGRSSGGGNFKSGGPSLSGKSTSAGPFQQHNFATNVSKSIGTNVTRLGNNLGTKVAERRTGNAGGSGGTIKKFDSIGRFDSAKGLDPTKKLNGLSGKGAGDSPFHGIGSQGKTLGHSLSGKAIGNQGQGLAATAEKLISGRAGRTLQLDKQFNLLKKGDVARQLDLHKKLIDKGWQHRFCGPVHQHYTSFCFGNAYCGPHCYPSYCWFPRWCGWVDWCWNYRRVYYYDPCDAWVYYHCPVWRPLPVVTCGTWVDVQPAIVASGYDLQLLAVRFVDPGHPQKNLGPRYRVWLRNNSSVAISSPFTVHLLAGSGGEPAADAPSAGVTVKSIDPHATATVDVRLPATVNAMTRTEQGQPAPFTTLHTIVDSGRAINETDEANNGAAVARRDVLPIDPALFDAEKKQLAAGQTINLAGEGLGPEAGQVLLNVGGVELQGEIEGWYDMGVRVKLPSLPLAGPTEANLVVVRGDGAASNPLSLQLAGTATSAAAIPAATP